MFVVKAKTILGRDAMSRQKYYEKHRSEEMGKYVEYNF